MEMTNRRFDLPRRLRAAICLAGIGLSFGADAALITVGPGAGCSTNSLSLALSVAALNGTDFDEIRVMEGTYTGVALSTSAISYSLTGGYNHCQLGAQALGRTNLVGNFRDSVLTIIGATNAYHNVTLSHLNISNGGASTNTPLYGAGIRARDLRLVLDETAVLNNTCGTQGDGGGIRLERSSNGVSGILELQRNVRVFGNTARNGGGISVENASLRIRPDGTEIFDNTARSNGGGLHLDNADVTVGSFGEPEVSNTASGLVVRDNRVTDSTGAGGGLYATGGLVDLHDTAFVGNRAPTGAGIYMASGQLQVGRDSPGLNVGCPASSPCMRFENNWTGNDCPGALSDHSGGAIALSGVRAFIHQAKFSGNCAAGGAVLWASGAAVPAPAIDIEGMLAHDNFNAGAWQSSISVSPGHDLRIRYSTLVRSWTRPTGSANWQLLSSLSEIPPTPGSYIRTSIVDVAQAPPWGNASAGCGLLLNGDNLTFRDPISGDYRLAATANGAIDRCSVAVAPIDYSDLERKPRCEDSPAHADGGGRCDIGAYEYDSDPFGYGFRSSFE